MQKIFFEAVPVEQELPPYPQIVTILLDGRIEMTAQIRPGENGPEWWTLGMQDAKPLESNNKCVTHWLKRVEEKSDGIDAIGPLMEAIKTHNEFYNLPTSWEGLESSPIEFMHGKLMDAFHEWRRSKTENITVEIDGELFSAIVVKVKLLVYEKYKKLNLNRPVPKTAL